MLTLDDLNFKLEGGFQTIVGSDGECEVVGDDQDNIIIAGRGKATILASSGHNIICNNNLPGEMHEATFVSGINADMFVIRKAPNSTIIIRDFKTECFDDSRVLNRKKFSDIINLVGFGIRTLEELVFEVKDGNLCIDLGDNQRLILVCVSALQAYNLRFDDRSYFFAEIEGDHPPANDTLLNIIYGVYQHKTKGETIDLGC